MKSPLRYPGGKSRAVKILAPYFPNIKELCSPFVGGGSMEIAFAQTGVRVYAYDVFEPLTCFWDYLINDNKGLYNEILKLHPMSRDQFYQYQKLNPTMAYGIEKAAMFYALNRASFGGSTLSGGMSPNHPRFNMSNLQTVLNFSLPNFTVEKLNYSESIEKHKNMFLYLDPPYLLEQQHQNKLYGVQGSTHIDFDHEQLFELLKDRNNWIMSYNNSAAILDMYKDFHVVEPKWSYGMSKDKNAKEALIFSKNLK
jgi:DNA adenine methylase